MSAVNASASVVSLSASVVGRLAVVVVVHVNRELSSFNNVPERSTASNNVPEHTAPTWER